MQLATELRQLLGDLTQAGIPHMVVGGVALEAFGVPRSTLDVDLQIRLDEPPLPYGSLFLGWFIEERSRDEVFGQDVLIVHRPVGATPFELFLTSHWFTTQALARRQTVRSALLGQDVPVPTVEDMVLLKAAFMVAPSRSPRKAAQDALDIEGIARGTTAMDRRYVEENGRKLGVWDALLPLLPGP